MGPWSSAMTITRSIRIVQLSDEIIMPTTGPSPSATIIRPWQGVPSSVRTATVPVGPPSSVRIQEVPAPSLWAGKPAAGFLISTLPPKMTRPSPTRQRPSATFPPLLSGHPLAPIQNQITAALPLVPEPMLCTAVQPSGKALLRQKAPTLTSALTASP